MQPKYKHVNSASRIHAVLSAALSRQTNEQMVEVWAHVFGVTEQGQNRKAHAVIERLNWFYTELRSLAGQVRASGMSPHLYESALARIESVMSPLNLPGPWQSYRGNLTADVLLALAFCNEMLPDEESAIDPAELSAIAAEVEELAEMLRSSQLPEALKNLIEHHVALIRRALAQYPLHGAKALREAGRTALGEVIESKDVVGPQQSTEEVSRLGALWKRVNTAADAALKGERVFQLGQRAWEALQSLLTA